MDVFRMVGSIALRGGKEATMELEQFDTKGKHTSATVEKLGSITENAGKLMKRAFIGVLATATALTAGLVKLVSEASQMETVSVAYEVLIGNAEKANKVIADLKQLSAKTPLSFNDITKAGQTLMAFGSASEDLQDKITMLGDLAMGNSQKLESVTRAYGKLQAKGRASMEELNIITEAGVPILDSLSKQYGVTTEELMKMVAQGKVGFDDVDKALKSLTATGGQFYGMMEKQSQTFSGLMSSMKDNISILMSELGAKLLPKIKPLIGNVTRAFDGMIGDLTSGDGAITVFSKALEGIVDWFVKVADTAMKVGMSIPVVWTFVSGVFSLVAKKIGDALQAPTEAILDFGKSLYGWIDSSGIKGAISTVWTFTISKVGDAWDFLINDAVPWIGSTIKTAWEVTVSLLGKALGWLETDVLPLVGKTASTVWEWTVNTAKAAIPVVLETVETVWNWIVDTSKLAIPVVSNAVSTVWEWVSDVSKVVLPVVSNTVSTVWKWTVEMIGDTYEALMKGFKTNDWSDLFGVAIELSQITMKIAVSWLGLSSLATSLVSGIQGGLSGIGVAIGSLGKLGAGGTLAMLSVGVALAEAVNEGGEAWGDFAANMGLAIVAGLTAGWLTKSPKVGVWVASIMLNFNIGEKWVEGLKKDFETVANPIAEWLSSVPTDSETRNPLKRWAYGIIDDMKVVFGDKTYTKALKELYGIEIGKQMLEGIGIGMSDIGELGEDKAKELVIAIREELGIHSPSVKLYDIAIQVIQGFINGMKDKFPELAELAETLMDDLSGIWAEQEEVAKKVADGVVDEITDTKRKSKVWAFFKDMGNGIWNGLKGAWDFTKGIWDAVGDFEWSWSNIWNGVKDIAVDAFFAIDAGMHKMLQGMKKLPGAFATFGSDLVGGVLGSIFEGSALSGGVEGFKSGMESKRKVDEEGNPVEGVTMSMVAGGVAGFLVGMAEQSEQFQALVESLQPLMDMIVNLFGRLVEPLLPLVDVLGNMLQPLLKALEPLIDVIGEMLFNMIMMLMQFIPPLISILTPILQVVIAILETVVMPVLKFIYKSLAAVYNTIANAINSLIHGINKVPGINIRWRMPTMNDDMPEYQRPAESSYDVDEEEAKSSSGGTQVSEITGPTRDLFVNLLSPLASLNSLTSIGNRIYDLLDERLGSALGVNIGEINIYGDADVNAEALADELEEILAGRMAFAMGGNA